MSVLGAAIVGATEGDEVSTVFSPKSSVGERVESAAKIGVQVFFPIVGSLGVAAYDGIKSLFSPDASDWKDAGLVGLGGGLGLPQGSLASGGTPGVNPPPGFDAEGASEESQLLQTLGLVAAAGLLSRSGGRMGSGLGTPSRPSSGTPSLAVGSRLKPSPVLDGVSPASRPDRVSNGVGGAFSTPSRPSRLSGTTTMPRARGSSASRTPGLGGFRSSSPFGGGGIPPSSNSPGDGFRSARAMEALIPDRPLGQSPYTPSMHPELMQGRMANAVRRRG